MTDSGITRLDHLVVAADTLDQGVEYIQNKLGVTLPFGGVHPAMGTHNHLAALGDDCFLEIIARNPEGVDPAHPRWFSLDDPQMLAQLRESPRLVTWVVNTDNINSLVKRAQYPCGIPTQISRGNLQWQFSLPEDGSLLAGGILPYIIQWQTDTHPAHAMKDVGLRLKSLTIYHPDSAWLSDMLRSISAERLVDIQDASVAGGPGLEAVISTARGDFTLSSIGKQPDYHQSSACDFL